MEISASKFKQMCLELMDRVAEFHEEVIITKRGKPVAKLVAIDTAVQERTILGCMQDRMKVCGDIVSPISDSWVVESDAKDQ